MPTSGAGMPSRQKLSYLLDEYLWGQAYTFVLLKPTPLRGAKMSTYEVE